MTRRFLCAAALLMLAACSSSAPYDGLDPLSRSLLRATSEVPAFGGVAFEPGDGAERLVVYTLGEAPAAAAVVRTLLGTDAEVRVRPARASGSEGLKDRVSAATFGEPGVVFADHDETTGYVRVGVLDAASVRRVAAALDAAQLPVEHIIVQLSGRIGY